MPITSEGSRAARRMIRYAHPSGSSLRSLSQTQAFVFAVSLTRGRCHLFQSILHAKDESFGGKTLAQFKEAIKPSMDARAKLAELESKVKSEATARDAADVESLEAANAVVRAVVGDEDFGPDSALYEAMGYVRKGPFRAQG